MTEEEYEKCREKIIDYMLEGFPNFFRSSYEKNRMFDSKTSASLGEGYRCEPK